ncbi:uncharacterized protein DS421_9g257120 [Arachis hypogaea]|nr:uncharacterized protein DS421_9g257120 [Arachis hypogaea]
MMKKTSAFEKMVMQKNKSKGSHEDQKKQQCNRLLVSINVLGSVGPIRFVVNEKDTVSAIIETALKSYAREGRLPLLGFDPTDFLLYNACFDGITLTQEHLFNSESIGSHRILWGEELCPVQEASMFIKGRTEHRADISEKQWW